MKKILLTTALIAGLTFVGFQQANARGYGFGPGGCCNKGGPGYGQNFTEEDQKAHKAFEDATVDLRKNMFSKQMEMQALMQSETPDASKVGSLAAEIFELKTQMQAKRDESGLKVGPGSRGYACNGPGAGYGYGMGPNSR